MMQVDPAILERDLPFVMPPRKRSLMIDHSTIAKRDHDLPGPYWEQYLVELAGREAGALMQRGCTDVKQRYVPLPRPNAEGREEIGAVEITWTEPASSF